MKRKVFWIVLLLVCVLGLTACTGSKVKDGTYTGEYIHPEKNYKVTSVNFDVKDGKITAFAFEEYNEDGTVKDENYGRDKADALYQLAQISQREAAKYPEMVVEAGDIEKVDAIAGATETLQRLKEAVKDAYKKTK